MFGLAQEDDESTASDETADYPESFYTDLQRSREARYGDVIGWHMCARFLVGEQYLGWGDRRTNLVPIIPEAGQNATITNILIPLDRTIRSVLDSQQPKVTITPTTPSADDVAKAIASREAAHWLWHNTKAKRVNACITRWLMQCGNAAIHVLWNSKAKKIEWFPVSGYDLLFEAFATSYQESAWRAVRCIKQRKDVIAAYPEQKQIIEKVQGLDNEEADGRMFTFEAPRHRIELWYVYWQDGRSGVYCGKNWLWKGRTPADVMPVCPIRYYTVEGRLLGIPMLYPVLDQQKLVNKYNNFALDVADVQSTSPWLIPQSAMVSTTQITNDPRKPIVYNPVGGIPQRSPAPQVPPHLFEIQNRVSVQAQDIAGVYPSMMGKRQGGVTSGVAISGLVDRGIAQLHEVMQNIEDANADAMRVSLVYWQHYLPESMQISMLDKTVGSTVFREIAGTQLVENPEVQIETGSMFAATGQDRDSELQQMFSIGAIDRDTFQSLLSEPLERRDALKQLVGLRHAEELLAAVVQKGLEIEIFPYDDLKAIAQVFEQYILSPAYYASAEAASLGYRANPNDQTATELTNALGIQEYLREILVAVQLPANTSQSEMKAMAATRIFPREPMQPMVAFQASQMPEAQGMASQPAPIQGQRQLPQQKGPPQNPGPVPRLQRPAGAPDTRGDPTQASMSNVRGGLG